MRKQSVSLVYLVLIVRIGQIFLLISDSLRYII